MRGEAWKDGIFGVSYLSSKVEDLSWNIQSKQDKQEVIKNGIWNWSLPNEGDTDTRFLK